MRISELLTAFATWLESPDNEALLLSEYDDDCLDVVATACSQAAQIFKNAAEQTDQLEGEPESKLTPESLDYLNEMVTAFDQSDNEDLQKTASIIDELLFTLAVPPNFLRNLKEAQKEKIDVLKQKYEDTKAQLDEVNKVKESAEAIDKSPMFKDYRIMEHALSTRTCPDHAGAQMSRVGENMWQCSLDKKTFNYTTGYTTEKGEKVPGGDVAAQTPMHHAEPHALFDTRESRLNGYIPN